MVPDGPLLPDAVRDIFAEVTQGIKGKMALSEFLLAIVKLAVAMHPTLPMDEGLTILVEHHSILHLARAVEPGGSGFHLQLAEPAVEAVLLQHRKTLHSIYMHYAAEDVSEDAIDDNDTINFTEFLQMLRDLRILGHGALNIKTVQEIFDEIQMEEGEDDVLFQDAKESEGETAKETEDVQLRQITTEVVGEADLNTDTELNFQEFQLGICSIAAVLHPNPYTPLHVKVATFIQETLVSRAKVIDD